MIQDTPRLVIILLALADVVAARNGPDHPTGTDIIPQEILNARRVVAVPLLVVLAPAKLGHEGRHPILDLGPAGCRRAQPAPAALHQGLLEARAVLGQALVDDVGVAVQLQDELILGALKVVAGPEHALAGRQVAALHHRLQRRVRIKPGEEDERFRVRLVDGRGALAGPRIPGLPVVRLLVEGDVGQGLAELVPQG